MLKCVLWEITIVNKVSLERIKVCFKLILFCHFLASQFLNDIKLQNHHTYAEINKPVFWLSDHWPMSQTIV
ncbi:hypothetical protein XELAEV_18031705mg [Xenopus laevis]|uniref:Uncharacterized protein n=1 Tax=Xenopus laevis TaxID=8355 RepID=A0A974HFW2_XENLA|nr:hypothetical protein XELAEV_18031705mg [Xenopus laevis]